MTGVALPLGERAAPTDRLAAGRHWTQPNAARCCVRPREGHLDTQGPGRPQSTEHNWTHKALEGLAGKATTTR